MALVRNKDVGPRGAYLDGTLVWADPGEAIEADDYADDWFEPAAGPLDHDADGKPGGSLPDDPPALSGKTRDELLAIAAGEGVDIDAIEGTGKDGNVLVDDIRDAIEANRA